MTRLTPRQTIEKFVSTYTELYQDICKYSQQDTLPLTMWLLSSDFNTVTTHQLETKSDNPFVTIEPILKKNQSIAYVIGGLAMMVKRIVDKKNVKSTDLEINSEFADEALIEEVRNDVLKTPSGDVRNDPKSVEVLLIASSMLDVTDLEYGKPELFKGKAFDKLWMYNITRENIGSEDRIKVNLDLEVDSIKNRIGNSSMINILGKRFGQNEK